MDKEKRKDKLINILLNMLSGVVDGNKLLKISRAIEKIDELYKERDEKI